MEETDSRCAHEHIRLYISRPVCYNVERYRS